MFHSRCTRVQQRKQTKLPKRTTQEIQMRTTGESCIYIVGPGLLDELKPTDRPKSAGTTSLELLLPRGNTGSWLTRPSTFEECQKLWFLCKISLFLNITYFVNFLKMVWVNKTCCVKGKYFPSWWFFRRRDIDETHLASPHSSLIPPLVGKNDLPDWWVWKKELGIHNPELSFSFPFWATSPQGSALMKGSLPQASMGSL